LLRGLPVDARSSRGANGSVSGHPDPGDAPTRAFEQAPESGEFGRPAGRGEPAARPEAEASRRSGAADGRSDGPSGVSDSRVASESSARTTPTAPTARPGHPQHQEHPEEPQRTEPSEPAAHPEPAADSGQSGPHGGNGGARVPSWAERGAPDAGRGDGPPADHAPDTVPHQYEPSEARGARDGARDGAAGPRPGGAHPEGQVPRAGRESADRRRLPAWAAEPVPYECHPAERLAAVLDALVAEHTAVPYVPGGGPESAAEHPSGAPESAELPGEAEAVSAFRAAHPGAHANGESTVQIAGLPTDPGTVVGRRSVRGAPGTDAGAAGGAGGGGPHGKRTKAGGFGRRGGSAERGDGRPGAARRVSVSGRPLRAGFVVAVAGCALGGVAVAAGTGVLPSPFGGTSPATSVSPAANQGATGGTSRKGGGNSAQGDTGSPDRDTLNRSPSASDGGDGHGHRGTTQGPSSDETRKGGHPPISHAEKHKLAVALCKAYEQGRLPADKRKKLEQAAGGPEGVRAFCLENGVGFGHDNGHGKTMVGGVSSGSGSSSSSGSDGNSPPESGGSDDSGGGHGSSEGGDSDSGGQGDEDGSGGGSDSGGHRDATSTPSSASSPSSSPSSSASSSSSGDSRGSEDSRGSGADGGAQSAAPESGSGSN